MNIQMEGMHREGMWGGAGSFHAISGHTTLPAPRVISNPQALWTPYYWHFYGGFIMYAWSVVNSTSSPSHLSGEWGMGLKIPSF